MTGIVTKELKAAMKKATTISIRLNQENAEIRCSKNIRKGNDGYTGTIESRHNGFRAHLPAGYIRAFYSDILHSSIKGNYAALNQLMRAGDELIFRCIENNNMYMKNAEIPQTKWKNKEAHHPDYYGLHNDTLQVTIMRKGKMVLTGFEIETSCTPDNSARRLQV